MRANDEKGAPTRAAGLGGDVVRCPPTELIRLAAPARDALKDDGGRTADTCDIGLDGARAAFIARLDDVNDGRDPDIRGAVLLVMVNRDGAGRAELKLEDPGRGALGRYEADRLADGGPACF